MKFKFGGVKHEGVEDSKGEVVVTRSTPEEGWEGGVVRASLSLQLGARMSSPTRASSKSGISLFMFSCINSSIQIDSIISGTH